jgi:hypothetical protein
VHVNTVTGVFPDLSEDGPRRKIIDSAFKMTEELVGASTNLTEKIMKTLTEGVSVRRRHPRGSTHTRSATPTGPAERRPAEHLFGPADQRNTAQRAP